jgi:peptidoglycan hydrolase-like protein with peptidoglycan-binding domain
LRAKVEAFEDTFERAGVKAYDSRMRYAQMALDSFATWNEKQSSKAEKPQTEVAKRQAQVEALTSGVYKPDKAEIEQIQTRLRDLGYFEVGEADGKAGSRTFGALTSFQQDNDLPLTKNTFDHVTIDLLMDLRTPKRPVSEGRATATAKDIDTPIVKVGTTLKQGGAAITGIAGAVAAIEGISSIDDLTGKVKSVKGLVDAVSSISPWLLVVGIGIGVIYFASKMVREQVQAYREGRQL